MAPDPRIGTVVRSVEGTDPWLLRLAADFPVAERGGRSRRAREEAELNKLSPAGPTRLEQEFLDHVAARPLDEVVAQASLFAQERVDTARAHLAMRKGKGERDPANRL